MVHEQQIANQREVVDPLEGPATNQLAVQDHLVMDLLAGQGEFH